ncbi:hypothetical protein [Peterkaempfera sp. SMS 1(5)a]|uniref:hypothetical protein n=1 Tax=Peterkaempfera podocarpi TaxID=3232308 RepID=UPI0036711F7F
MKRYARASASLLAAVAATVGFTTVQAGPASADVGSCTVTPSAGQASGGGSATCPAGAGAFTFRVVVDCYDGYPVMHFQATTYGPWVQASATAATVSAVVCHGYVPGSGVGMNAHIETQ